jgi:Cys-rich protein (TIGR01571 family)
MHRLKLTPLAKEGRTLQQTAATFRTMFILGILFYPLRLLASVPLSVSVDDNGEISGSAMFIVLFKYFVFGVYVFFLVLMCRTRRHIRNKFQIPETDCSGCEDCCCVYWCTFCTVAQMARHTGDYEVHGVRCCSETGLPPNASNDVLELHSIASIV